LHLVGFLQPRITMHETTNIKEKLHPVLGYLFGCWTRLGTLGDHRTGVKRKETTLYFQLPVFWNVGILFFTTRKHFTTSQSICCQKWQLNGDSSSSVEALFILRTWTSWRHRHPLARCFYRQMKRQACILKLYTFGIQRNKQLCLVNPYVLDFSLFWNMILKACCLSVKTETRSCSWGQIVALEKILNFIIEWRFSFVFVKMRTFITNIHSVCQDDKLK